MPPRKKFRRKGKGSSSPARVDDTLVRSYEVRQEIRARISSYEASDLTVDDSRYLAEEIQAQGAPAIQAVLDCLFDDDANVQRIALMVLTEIDDPALSEKIALMLKRPQLPEKVRGALLAVEALHEDIAEIEESLVSPDDLSVESLLSMASNFWEGLEMEEIAMMWLDNFSEEAPEDRLGLLELLMKAADSKMLGVVRLEIAQGDLKILQFLAENLGQYSDPFAVGLLQDLLTNSDLVVRTLADQSLTKLKKRMAALGKRGNGPAFLKPRFHRAHIAADEASGHYSLVYAVKSLDDSIKFFVALLERWDRGVVDCWGNARYTKEQFDELLKAMRRDFADLRQKRISKATALTYLERAIKLNVQRKHPIPLQMSVWTHLFENQRYRVDPGVPPFGVKCAYCRKPVRTRPRRPPIVLADLVVCPKCSKRKLECSVCGGTTTLADCLLVRENAENPLDLRCPHCFESLEAGT